MVNGGQCKSTKKTDVMWGWNHSQIKENGARSEHKLSSGNLILAWGWYQLIAFRNEIVFFLLGDQKRI